MTMPATLTQKNASPGNAFPCVCHQQEASQPDTLICRALGHTGVGGS